MAADVTAILTACEEVALGALGTAEVVPTDAFVRGVYLPLAIGQAANALVHARVEIEISGPRDTGTVPRSSNSAVLQYGVVVRCSFSTGFELDDDGRKATRALATMNTELMRAALTHPQNIAQTAEGAVTGIVGGCLLDATTRVVREDHKVRIYITEIAARILVQTTRAT